MNRPAAIEALAATIEALDLLVHGKQESSEDYMALIHKLKACKAEILAEEKSND
jgi:hypothetical protein